MRLPGGAGRVGGAVMAATIAVAAAPAPQQRPVLEGVWVHGSTDGVLPARSDGRVRIIAGEFWSVGAINGSSGGRYSVRGSDYIETPDPVGRRGATAPGVPRAHRFRLDKAEWRLTDVVSGITERWWRVVTLDPGEEFSMTAAACENSPLGRAALLHVWREAEAQGGVPAPLARLQAAASRAPGVAAELELATCVVARGQHTAAVPVLQQVLGKLHADIDRARATAPASPSATMVGRLAPIPARTVWAAPGISPELARVNLGQTLVLHLGVSRDGTVTQASVVRSMPPFDDLMRDLSRKWVFEPVMFAGTSTNAEFDIPVPVGFGKGAVDDLDTARFLYGRGQFATVEQLVAPVLAEVMIHARRAELAGRRVPAGEFGAGALVPGGGTSGIAMPRALAQPTPAYTRDAMRLRLQGNVDLEAVVLEDGTVGPVRVVRSLDRVAGLDEEALRAARLWRFEPARNSSGAAVPVLVMLQLSFRLH